MQRKTLLLTAAAVLVVGGLLAWAFAPRPIEVEVATVSEGPFRLSIDEDAKTRLAERYQVSAPLSGRLARITLREGDAVAAGDVVATLTPALSPLLDERTSRSLAERVQSAEAQLAMAGSGIERAQVTLEQARNELRRTEQLAQQGFVAPTKLDTDRLGLKAAQKGLDVATEQRHLAEHELAQARAAQAAVQPGASRSAGAFALRAPVAGRVLRVLQASEGTVALGTPLLEIGDTARLEIVAELLTTDALALPPNAPVLVERWGGPGTLDGRVRRVEPAASTKVSALGVEEQRVKVLIDLLSPPTQWQALGDGYRVSVRIVTLAADQALQVPVSAVFPLPAGAPGAPGMAVFTLVSGQAHQVPVTLGGRNGSTAWIKEGLAKGDTVIVYPPAAVVEGGRVKMRKV